VKIQFYLAALSVVALASTACVAGSHEKKPSSPPSTPNYITSEKIKIQVQTNDDDPKSWLKMYFPTVERNIPIIIEFDVENVVLVNITDEQAGKGLCERHYPENLFYLLSKTPMKTKRIKTLIGKPCLINRSAKMKLRIISKQKEYLERIHSFTIDPISGAQ